MTSSSDPDPKLDLNASAPGRTPWYQDIRVIGILLVLFGLLVLPLVWFNKTFTMKKKVVITVISVVIAGVLLVIGNHLMNLLEQKQTSFRETRTSILTPSSPAATAGLTK
jgi:hypothetical protein